MIVLGEHVYDVSKVLLYGRGSHIGLFGSLFTFQLESFVVRRYGIADPC